MSVNGVYCKVMEEEDCIQSSVQQNATINEVNSSNKMTLNLSNVRNADRREDC